MHEIASFELFPNPSLCQGPTDSYKGGFNALPLGLLLWSIWCYMPFWFRSKFGSKSKHVHNTAIATYRHTTRQTAHPLLGPVCSPSQSPSTPLKCSTAFALRLPYRSWWTWTQEAAYCCSAGLNLYMEAWKDEFWIFLMFQYLTFQSSGPFALLSQYNLKFTLQ